MEEIHTNIFWTDKLILSIHYSLEKKSLLEKYQTFLEGRREDGVEEG
jgi:hypothetical protein